MKQKICFIVWPPANKYVQEVIAVIKEKYKVISFGVFEFPETQGWASIVNMIYNQPIDSVTVKRYKKAEGLEGYDKKLNVIVFEIVNPKYKKKKGKEEIIQTNELKKVLRDEVFTDLPRWYVVHSTETTEETEEVLKIFNSYCIQREGYYEDI